MIFYDLRQEDLVKHTDSKGGEGSFKEECTGGSISFQF